MIKVQRYTPEIYYKNSRDFQALGRICEVLYNYVLMNIDNMLGSPVSDNTNPILLELALLTLGFDRHHNYTNVDLIKLAEIFKYVMKIKGTRQAIEEIVYLLLRSQSVEVDVKVDVHTLTGKFRDSSWQEDPSQNKPDTYSVDIYLSDKLQDIVLIEDVFDYILPAGFIYHIYLSQPIENVYETGLSNDNYYLNMGEFKNVGEVIGQVFNSSEISDNNPIIELPKTSRTFTTVIVSSDNIKDSLEEEQNND